MNINKENKYKPFLSIRKRYGFTLIEAVLYLAIAGTALYFISGFSFNIIFGKAKIESIEELNDNSQIILDEISDTISDSLEINNFSIEEE